MLIFLHGNHVGGQLGCDVVQGVPLSGYELCVQEVYKSQLGVKDIGLQFKVSALFPFMKFAVMFASLHRNGGGGISVQKPWWNAIWSLRFRGVIF